MKKLLGGFALLAIASPAMAVLGTGQFINDPNAVTWVNGVNADFQFSTFEDGGDVDRALGNNMYSAMTGPFAGFAAATGNLGFDDYVGIVPPGDADGNSPLEEFGFVGGVTTVGGIVQIQVYNVNSDLVNFVNIALPSAGNFIWTITPSLVPGDDFFSIPNAGFVQMVAAPTTTGQWFLSTSLPTIGTESRAAGMGSLTTHSHRFRLDVPEPASMALLALGGLFAARRRK